VPPTTATSKISLKRTGPMATIFPFGRKTVAVQLLESEPVAMQTISEWPIGRCVTRLL